MTFLEAAIEVLRREQEPLHFSEIAKRAVERKLLSHVGRDPEAAMHTCLNSAVRGGDEALVQRARPGYYEIRPGAVLPDPALHEPSTPAAAPTPPAVAAADEPADPESDAGARGRRVRARRGRPDEGVADSASPSPSASPATGAEPVSRADALGLEFEAPTGSGLEGVTDVALVMANAMSRLAEERPELREELVAMQTRPAPAAPPASGPIIQTRPTRVVRPDPEERGGRRRRRRRRRARRVDWTPTGPARGAGSTQTDDLLASVASVLEGAGPRSLHVRQIAESLAAQNVLGGEISEIERAVTSAILLDVGRKGRASRIAVRGDARYQLQGGRLPDAAARAERAFHEAARALETETRAQLEAWLASLGARALESLVRIWLQQEGMPLLATLPPARGLGKLVAEDPEGDEEDNRVLVLVVPRRTSLEPKLWEGEAERNQCTSTIVFTMGEVDESVPADARTVQAGELADWMLRNRIAVGTLEIKLAVLDPAFIESIAGLDT
jgi:hypothetical protein